MTNKPYGLWHRIDPPDGFSPYLRRLTYVWRRQWYQTEAARDQALEALRHKYGERFEYTTEDAV